MELTSSRGTRRAFWMMGSSYALWLLAWVMTTPLFSTADEWAHYLRALGIREGRLVGDRPPEGYAFPEFSAQEQDFLRQTSRAIDVPAGMGPRGYACNAFQPEQSAGCLSQATAGAEATREVTVTGAYPPAFYLLPALAMMPAQGPASALLLARLASALTCALLLLFAVGALVEAGPAGPALTAFAMALTPMGLATMAGLSPSGPEIAGALAFAAGLCRLVSEDRPGRWAWTACMFGGVALVLARPLGVAWAALHVGIFLGLSWRAGLVRLARLQRGRVVGMGVMLLGAALLSRLWEHFQGARVPVTFLPGMKALREAFKNYPEWLREQVGIFQYLDALMPAWAYPAWGLLVVALVVWQWPRLPSSWRWRACVLSLGILAAPIGLYVTVVRNSGFWLQGRYVLPISCALPLLFGAGPARRLGDGWTARGRTVCVALASGAGVLQWVAWYSNARRSAVGSLGPWLFFSHAEWSPPLGWVPWSGLTLACAVALPLSVWWAGDEK